MRSGIIIAGCLLLAGTAFTQEKDPRDPEVRVLAAHHKRVSIINLKQIGLAFHNYDSTFGTGFPTDIRDGNGKALLSWRVAILPYLEQEELYKEFKLNEPWDSEHNRKLIEKIPRLYTSPRGDGDKGKTYYQCFSGPGAILQEKPVKIQHIQDGTACTFAVAEAGAPVIWTKPEDIPFDVRKPLPKLGGLFGGDFHVVFADGSVHSIRKTVKEETLKKFITIADGESVDMKDLK